MSRTALGAWLTIVAFVLLLVFAAWYDDNRCDDGWYLDRSSEMCEPIDPLGG